MVFEGTECDLTTHEVAFALLRLVKDDGNVLERILSPWQLVDDLVALKGSTHERVPLPEDLDTAVRSQWARLEVRLDRALEATTLPKSCPTEAELEAWLLDLRRRSW